MKSLSPIFSGVTTLLIVFFALQCGNAQFYNGSQQEFGKNRVQYKKFDWLYYPGENVDVFFYNGGKDLAQYAVESAEKSLLDVQTLFDFTLQERVQLVLYNTQTDFRQSNIGITDDSQDNIGGTIPIVGAKIFAYFDGDHQNLETQIKENLSRVIFRQMMYGGNWKTVLRSSAFLTIPDWYVEGLASFAGEEWSAEADQYIRDGIMSGLYRSFNDVQGEQVRYSGHAMWKFISDVYGDNVIPNILYMTKISRNIEDGFLFVLGKDMNNLSNEFIEYWSRKFKSDEVHHPELEINRLYTEKQLEKIAEWKERDKLELEKVKLKRDELAVDTESKKFQKIQVLINNWDVLGYEGKKWRKLDKKFSKYLGAIPVKAKSKYVYGQFKRSPDGEYMSFVTHELGQYKVWLYHISSGKLKRIAKREHKVDRIQDLSYPNSTWHPSSDILTYITERRGRVYINNYQISEKKTNTKELFRIDKVIDMSYSDDGKKIAFSGVAQGQTDIYMYYSIGNNQTRLTNDVYDDLNPSFIPGTEKLLFASNRPDDTLRRNVPVKVYPNMKDIFLMNTEGEISLEQITRTPDIDEEEPQAINEQYYSFLSYRDGFRNRYGASVDSVISRIDTAIHYRYFTREVSISDYAFQLKDYEINTEKDTYGYSIFKNGSFQYNTGTLSDRAGESNYDPGANSDIGEVEESGDFIPFISEPAQEAEKELDPDNYVFEDDEKVTEYEKEIVRIGDIDDQVETDSAGVKKFVLPKPRNYILNFVLDEVTTQFDNSLDFDMYQQIGYANSQNPGGGLGGVAKASDLFEDFKFKGSGRLNLSRTSTEVGLIYSNLAKRLDKHYSLARYSSQGLDQEQPNIIENRRILGKLKLSYPLDEIRSFRLTLLGMIDSEKKFATDINNISDPIEFDYLGGLRASYVFDNTRVKGINLLEGTRYKLFGEYYIDPIEQGKDMTVIGVDFRHYEHIYRHLTFAFRFAGSTSFGSRTIQYNLGGLDNELLPKFATNALGVSPFFYRTQASPVRGFFLNSRQGNNFSVMNSELRWPVFKFFSKKPLSSEFTESFQFMFFTDVGSSWSGLHPYSDDNTFNTIVYEGNPVTISLGNNKEPIIWGYGMGARAKLFGYFVRADYAWGVDDGQIQDGVLHISLNMDF